MTTGSATFTPGPWTIDDADPKAIKIRDAEGRYTVAIRFAGAAELSDEDETARTLANARLIAAAPELLEALRGLVKAEYIADLKPYWTKAHAAIAKAEGDGQ